MRVLALNAGSSSLKFELVETETDGEPGRALARGAVRGFGDLAELTLEAAGRIAATHVSASGAGAAVRAALRRLAETEAEQGGTLLEQVQAAGHRVVHGGDRFTAPVVVDTRVVAGIASLEDLAPLHNAAALAGIRAAFELLGETVPTVAVFDTAFFHDLPERAATYAIPHELARRHGIRRFGFHGISHAYLAERYGRLAARDPGRSAIITLHLGSGCSAAAIRAGRPVDTSMGFTPLEGLVMGTRSGDVDPTLVAFLSRREGVPTEEVETWFNRRSGLLGVSGTSADPRDLLAAAAGGDRRAKLALDLFCYRARKYVGAYLAALGGAEAVVFAGGVGENLPDVRARICEGLEWCGLRLDPARNAAAVGVEARIGADGSTFDAYVIPTREERWIARATARCLTAGANPRKA